MCGPAREPRVGTWWAWWAVGRIARTHTHVSPQSRQPFPSIQLLGIEHSLGLAYTRALPYTPPPPLRVPFRYISNSVPYYFLVDSSVRLLDVPNTSSLLHTLAIMSRSTRLRPGGRLTSASWNPIHLNFDRAATASVFSPTLPLSFEPSCSVHGHTSPFFVHTRPLRASCPGAHASWPGAPRPLGRAIGPPPSAGGGAGGGPP